MHPRFPTPQQLAALIAETRRRPSWRQRFQSLPALLPILLEGRWLRLRDEYRSLADPAPAAAPVVVRPGPHPGAPGPIPRGGRP